MSSKEAVAWLRRQIEGDKVMAESAAAPYLDDAARCDAHLALLDVHAPVEDDGRLICQVCVTWNDDQGEYESGTALPVLWPCMTLDIVAAGYRHRNGYAEHWDAQPCPACGKPDVVLPLGHDLAVPMDGSAPFCEVRPPPDPGIVTRFLAYE